MVVASTISLGMALGTLSAPHLVIVISHPDMALEMAALVQMLQFEDNLKGVPILESQIEDDRLPVPSILMEQIRQLSSPIYQEQK